jgi:ferredoxin
MRYDIHFFSGTGNTERAVRRMAEKLTASGHEASVSRIVDGKKPEVVPGTTLVIAFPVYSWTVPALVRRFIRMLPQGKGSPAVLFCTFGGNPLQAPAYLSRMMRRRGYGVTATGGARYPDNWTEMLPPMAGEEAEKALSAGDAATEAFAEALARGESPRFRDAGGNGFWSWLVGELFVLVGRRVLGKLFAADSSCNGCSLCARSCPAGAIRMRGGQRKRPTWNFSCENCCRCINICPRRSIQTSLTKITALGIVAVVVVIFTVSGFLLFGKAVPAGYFPLSVVLAVILAHAVVFAVQYLAVEPALFALQEGEKHRKILDWTFTRDFPRYVAPGWKVSEDE